MNRFVIIKSENNYELENKVNEFLTFSSNSPPIFYKWEMNC